jgi:hypothetical protein
MSIARWIGNLITLLGMGLFLYAFFTLPYTYYYVSSNPPHRGPGESAFQLAQFLSSEQFSFPFPFETPGWLWLQVFLVVLIGILATMHGFMWSRRLPITWTVLSGLVLLVNVLLQILSFTFGRAGRVDSPFLGLGVMVLGIGLELVGGLVALGVARKRPLARRISA